MIQRYSIGDLLHKSHFGDEKYCLSEDVEKLEEQNKQLLDMINVIPCTCDDAYKDRGLIAPDCPRCNYIDEDLITGKKPEDYNV
jgi:hypothetical protein